MHCNPRPLVLPPIPRRFTVPLRNPRLTTRRPPCRLFWTRPTPLSPTMAPRTSIDEFKQLLSSSNRILALCGAGLSAASGLPTFRGADGLWRDYDPTALATPGAFRRDPALVWLFYAWRRHMALTAQPNCGHFALAELAKKKDNFLCLTQNVDGRFLVRG